MIFFTAFLTGLLGSFHCVGMCGPIALALPQIGHTTSQKVWSRLLYNFGRITTYALLGILLGTFGLGLKLAGWQQSISIASGVLIILTVIISNNVIEKALGHSFRKISGKWMGKLFSQQQYSSLFLIGILNGLLPCGFVYIALIGAVATQNTLQGALFMTLFGLGTLPMMFGVSMVGQFISQQIRNRINQWVPVFAILIGALFILRGLGLGIPYVSPKMNEEKTMVKDCCKPENKGTHEH